MRKPALTIALTAAALTLTVPSTGMLSAAPAAAATSDIVSVPSSTRAADAQQLLELINAHRKAKGLAPVKYSATVSGIAQNQSDRLVRQEVLDHTNVFLTDPRAGAWTAAGEIHTVAWRPSVHELMNWWKGSTAHNKVLTDPKMQVLGIGLTYADGSLAGSKEPWQLVGTITSYSYPAGKAPADTSTAVTATYPLTGAIGSQHARLGGSAAFGDSTGPERPGLDGRGVWQSFADTKHSFYWSPSTGAWPVKFSRAIGQRWKAAGYERGYGYPVTDEYVSGTEVRQKFSNGHTVHWSSVTRKTWVTG